MNTATQKIAVMGVGIALFVALSLLVQVPVFDNYYLCLGYAVMAVYCYAFGAVSGSVVGALGVVVYCLVTSGLRGMPGWALGNVVIGILLALAFRCAKKTDTPALKAALWTVGVIVSTALGILVVKSVVDSIIRAQPVIVRMGMNINAFIADAVVLLVSLPLCAALDKPLKKMFPKLIR